jgi:hypothetical protein
MAAVVVTPLNITNLLQIFKRRIRHPSISGTGEPCTAAPPSSEHEERSWSTAELHRNFAVEGETTTCKKPIQSRRRLHDATGWLPRHAYTIYTKRIGPPPSSRRRSGRRRAREPPNRQRRGGVPWGRTNRPSFL